MTSILKQQINQQEQQEAQAAAAAQQQQQHQHGRASTAPRATVRVASPSSTIPATSGQSRPAGPVKGIFSARRPSQLAGRSTASNASPANKTSYATPDRSVSPKRETELDEEAMSTGEETDDLDMEGVQKRDMAIAAQRRKQQASADATGAGHEDADGSDEMEEDGKEEEIALDASMSGAGLAETWLPQLFHQHGPLAIRHLTQFLAHGNATFGALVPGQQRRAVVKALESRKGVLFEKVGWGRWALLEGKYDAALTGNHRAPGYFTPESLPMQMRSTSGQGTLSASLKRSGGVPHPQGMPTSSYQSHNEFLFSPSLSVGVPREEDEDVDPLDLDEESGTDEEDWKSLGAEALRRRTQAARVGSVGQHGGPASFSEKSMPMSPAMHAGSFASPRHGPMRPGSYSGSSPYPIRRKSSAGIYQLHHHHHHHGAGGLSGSPGGVHRPPTFPKSSSFVRNTRISPDRLKGASAATVVSSSHGAAGSAKSKPATIPGQQQQQQDTEAAEALFLLSNSFEGRGGGGGSGGRA